MIGYISIPQQKPLGHIRGIVHAGHGDRYGQRPRRAYNAVIRVLGQSQIIAIGIVISRGGLIAGGYQYVDARLLRPGIDATVGEISVHLLAGIVVVFGKASGRAQGEVGCICAQLYRIVQTRQNDIVAGGAGAVAEDLHHQKLGIGGHAEEVLTVVARHRTSHMDTVVNVRLGAGVSLRVVKAKGDFFADVYLVGGGHAAGETFFQELLDVLPGILGFGGHNGKSFVIRIHARVQNSHHRAGAIIPQLVGLGSAYHAGGAGHGDCGLRFPSGIRQRVLLRHKSHLDLLHLPDRLQVSIGNSNGEAVERRRIVIF